MSVSLFWNNDTEDTEVEQSVAQLERLLSIAAQQQDVSEGEVSLTFVDDDTIQELNAQYRGMDKPTDVLSFAMKETTDEEPEIWMEEEDQAPDEMLGDIIISIPTARRQAEEYGHSLEREIGFLFVHGFLHLLGYDHQSEEDERQMVQLQEEVLQAAGLTR